MRARIQTLLLRLWGRVPRLARRWIVRAFAPSFTVGAACVIDRDDGSVLLVRLVYRNGWGLPGGLINRREDIATCGRREVLEEIGLPVELVGEPAVVVDARPQRVDVIFRARPAHGVDPDSHGLLSAPDSHGLLGDDDTHVGDDDDRVSLRRRLRSTPWTTPRPAGRPDRSPRG